MVFRTPSTSRNKTFMSLPKTRQDQDTKLNSSFWSPLFFVFKTACRVVSCLALICLVLSCLVSFVVLSCLVLCWSSTPCLVLCCLMSCLVLSCVLLSYVLLWWPCVAIALVSSLPLCGSLLPCHCFYHGIVLSCAWNRVCLVIDCLVLL